MTRPPNTRMQRTRSSPSARHSPLMRCPLGGRLLGVAIAIAGAVTVISQGCMGWGDMDPFRHSYRNVCGDIQLWWPEGDSFALTDRSNNDADLGVGNIRKMGVGNGAIVVWGEVGSKRVASGWFIVDCHAKSIVGPLSNAELQTNRSAQGIDALEIRKAWERLPK